MMGKRNFLPLLFFLGLFNWASAQHDPHCDKDFSDLHQHEMLRHEALLNFRGNEVSTNFDLKYHRLEWTIDPAVLYIQGAVTSYFEALEADFQSLHFDLSDDLTVDSVVYHGQQLSHLFIGSYLLKIDLPQPINEGVLDSVTIYYQGAPQSGGFGSFAKSTHNGIPVLWTLSEPYGARDWWPCKQDLNDKIDSIDVIVTTPSAYRAASNGKLVGEWQDGGDKVYHWRHRYPIPAYLIAIAVTNYAYYSDWVPHPEGDIEVLNYVFPENLSSAMAQTQAIVEIMQLFNDISGRYPFADEKYGHAQFGWGGGMEHQTMSFMGGFSYGLQAHELAHQWFGDKVTCGSWEDIWLNEGFATYWTGLTDEFLGSPAAWMNWKTGKINHITSQPGGSVWVDDTTSVSRIFSSRLSYSKGAYLLHMLRWVLGSDDFFLATNNYLEDPELAFGYAHNEDLQAHLEAVSGLDLDEFFADWYYGQGYPSYELLWDHNNGYFLLIANQTTSHASVPFFEMPLPVKLIGATQDTIVRLDHTQNGQLFAVPVGFEVLDVEFDPDLWILSKDNTVEQSPINGLAEQGLADKVVVRPNPGMDHLEVMLLSGELWLEQVRIYDATGRLIDSRILENGQQAVWNTSAWPQGSYLVFAQTAQGYVSKWWVKN